MTDVPFDEVWMTDDYLQTKTRGALCQREAPANPRRAGQSERRRARSAERARLHFKSCFAAAAAASSGPAAGRAHLLAKVFDEAVGEASQRRELERPGDGAAEGGVAQGVQVELLLEVALVGGERDGEPLHRAAVDADEVDEVGLARLVGDAEEAPLLELLAHLRLGVEL